VADHPVLTTTLGAIEAQMPVGVRARQLSVRSLVLGMLLTISDGRPAHLARGHRALVSLPEADRWRLGIKTWWRTGPHLLTYRQVERTFSLVVAVLRRDDDAQGTPGALLQELLDGLLEASIDTRFAQTSTSLAVDWTDVESFARPVRKDEDGGADREASWGHRRRKGPGQKDELFFGYFAQLATMVNDEGGDEIPELVRRMTLSSCKVDPPALFVSVLCAMPTGGIVLGDVLCDSGYAHRLARSWALPLRRAGARLVMDLHPHDRGPRGTHDGAVVSNGSLYCPATPEGLLAIKPPARDSDAEALAAHDRMTEELHHYP
jgi:hypothetical protein